MDNKKVFEEKKKKIVNAYNCINCFKCIDKCPEDDCLKVKFLGKTIFRSKYGDKEEKKKEEKKKEEKKKEEKKKEEKKKDDKKDN